MSLMDRIGEDIKAAMKSKDKVRLETVRGIKKVLLEKKTSGEVGADGTLSESQELEVLMQQAKQRRDAIAAYRQAGREDLAAQETAELEIIEEYLPRQLSEAEIAAVVDDIIGRVGASSPKDMGKVMGPAMQQLKGQADGKLVQKLVKEQLNG
ncbi:GatB/YqeY domain-containing protein [Lyngbya sp. CCY1209]|uniref:GatB/YqeY domain-containing protein n=1 Tax=Lyngbya sp. CCY1209 TaxID=2886103 RepID=UPI002D212B1F|nr:GatB/YqeY domain-containing protein [Lyngbya sp. CCY1209]MEB3883461.1 GatB/YqeY domain-containing protein [Lyngbya sp. CCY1209]